MNTIDITKPATAANILSISTLSSTDSYSTRTHKVILVRTGPLTKAILTTALKAHFGMCDFTWGGFKLTAMSRHAGTNRGKLHLTVKEDLMN